MTETTISDKLRISEGYVVWVIGESVEETALLDPLPEGAVAIEQRTDDDDDELQRIDGAILFAESSAQLVDDLDEFLPQLGSIPIVWICFPAITRGEIDAELVEQLVGDYGWQAVEHVPLDDDWSGVRLEQA